MNTLILNGSPHKNGGSMSLLKELTKHLMGNIDIFSSYGDNIGPSDDCRHCWKNENCRIDDDMQNLYTKINDYDNVSIISPLYFSKLSGSLLNMCSRLQYFWTARHFRKLELITKKKRHPNHYQSRRR